MISQTMTELMGTLFLYIYLFTDRQVQCTHMDTTHNYTLYSCLMEGEDAIWLKTIAYSTFILYI